MPHTDELDYLGDIERESAIVAEVLASHPGAPVATCPGWVVSDLAVHLGVTQRWATAMVAEGSKDRMGDPRGRFGTDQRGPALVEWFREGAEGLVSALKEAPLEREVWSWTSDHTAGFWRRRQAHEVAIHRFDAEEATGAGRPIRAELASDGVDEYLGVFAVGRSRARSERLGEGESYHFHCTDVAGEWLVRFPGSGIEVERAHAKADVALRAPASDLVLWLWGRCPAERLEVLGDVSLVVRWSELVPSV